MDGSSHYDKIERAIRFIEDNRLEQPNLDEIAVGIGMSPFHLQRVFTAWAGVSPKLFLRYVTLDHAREALMDASPVLDAALDVGLSGPGRLHDLFVTLEAATPGEVGAGGRGLDIRYGLHDGPFGRFLVAATERGVCRIGFEQEGEDQVGALGRAWPNARLVEDEAHTWSIAGEALTRGMTAGDSPIRLWARGTNFQIKVWEALLRVPAGRLASYGDIARAVGNPRASRAVGRAVGANPIAVLIPCHRAIRASGRFETGYRWGSARKRALIAWEASRREGAGADAAA
ncbi:MAG: methylated-DNA--[protein]-cysteine S-methyltransferase [Defluviicoccus sp.]|nr:methylated-DNA--[protein]-cysteine S-methyltransferase [Defluviicoccus sp.]